MQDGDQPLTSLAFLTLPQATVMVCQLCLHATNFQADTTASMSCCVSCTVILLQRWILSKITGGMVGTKTVIGVNDAM